jgi:[ribosomal protein S5]-alanine N-acetyltransferase
MEHALSSGHLATERLATERLALRPVTALDLTALVTHWTAPEVRLFLFDWAVLSAEDIDAVIAESSASSARDGYGFWLAESLDEAGFVGTVGLRQLEDLGPEIVYSLAPDAWGSGYASESARAVLEYALGTLGLPEVLAEVDQGNAASAAVVTRLGMVPFDVAPGLLGPITPYRISSGSISSGSISSGS